MIAPAVSPLPHVCILASAGSGKTYQLTNRYLRLIADGRPPSSILASTFTRAAAGEIRGRILMRLVEAAEKEKDRALLSTEIDRALDGPEVCVLLRRLTENIHRLQIRTLDSFFASLTTTFALELGLPPGSDIAEENQLRQMRADAVRRLLDEHDPQALTELFRLLTRGESTRGVGAAIDEAIDHMYTLYRDVLDQEGADRSAVWMYPAEREELEYPVMTALIERLSQLLVPEDKWIKPHRAAVDCALRHDWSGFLSAGIGKNVASDGNADGELNYKGWPIPDEMLAVYEPLCDHAAAVLINRCRAQNQASRLLLDRFHIAYEQVKRANHALSFDDLTRVLVWPEYDLLATDMRYRIDAQIQHWLLDEFQDTSIPQWRVLEPFVSEALSNGYPDSTFFCVGDVKQSIYSFRDAEPDVLGGLAARYPDRMQEQTLSKSWRSSQPVIETVNRVFAALPDADAINDDQLVAQDWSDQFVEHETERTKLPGRVELRTVRLPETHEKGADVRVEAAADLVAQLHSKFPDMSIAVLVRRNDTAGQIRYAIGPSGKKIECSEPGGVPLTDAAPVNAILDALTLADHHDDTAAAFHIASSPLKQVFERVDDSFYLKTSRSDRRRIGRRIRRAIVRRGYPGVVDDWVRQIAAAVDGRELRRLQQLVELAERFEPQRTLRTRDFVDFVEQTRMPDVRPARVHVMTMHKAKGLEYDIVILPELEAPLAGYSANDRVVYQRANKTGPITHITRRINENIRALCEPEIEAVHEAARRRTVRESLNLLYVGMTRAKQGLFMLIEPDIPGVRQFTKTPARLLAQTIGDADVDSSKPPPATLLYECGSGFEATAAKNADVSPPVKRGKVSITLRASDSLNPRGVSAPPPSSHASKGDRSVGSLLHFDDDDARQVGSAMHFLFEQVRWIEDVSLDRSAMTRIARRGLPNADDEWIDSALSSFLDALERPAVREQLSRTAFLKNHGATSAKVWRELPFVRSVDGAIQRGTIDRLSVAYDQNESPISATVIDYKTDAFDPSQPEAETSVIERYNGQLDIYRSVAARRIGIDKDKIERVLLMLAADHAISI